MINDQLRAGTKRGHFGEKAEASSPKSSLRVGLAIDRDLRGNGSQPKFKTLATYATAGVTPGQKSGRE